MPGVSFAACCEAFAAVIVNNGLSRGTDRRSLLARPAAGGCVRPPSQAGMVPSALPARSAPTGVRSLPSREKSRSAAAAGRARSRQR